MEITLQTPSFLLPSCYFNYLLSHQVRLAISLLVSLLLIFLVRIGKDEWLLLLVRDMKGLVLNPQLSVLLLLSADFWPGAGGTRMQCSQKSQCFAVQHSAHSCPSYSFKFPRPDFGAPSSLRNQQSSVPHDTSGVVFQLPGWSDASAAKLHHFPGVRIDRNGNWRKGRCLSQHHNRSPLSLASWKWVCAWLVAMHLWMGHYISLCWAELMTLRFVWVCFERLGCSCLKFPLKYVHLALLVMSWISYCLYCTVSLLHRILTALIIPLTIQLD